MLLSVVVVVVIDIALAADVTEIAEAVMRFFILLYFYACFSLFYSFLLFVILLI